MNTKIKATSYKILPETSRYLDTRLAALEKLLSGDADTARCEVEIGRAAGNKHSSEHMWYAEIRISVPGGAKVYATNHASTVNAAIDDVKAEVERQLRTQKKRKQSAVRKGGAAAKRKLRGA